VRRSGEKLERYTLRVLVNITQKWTSVKTSLHWWSDIRSNGQKNDYISSGVLFKISSSLMIHEERMWPASNRQQVWYDPLQLAKELALQRQSPSNAEMLRSASASRWAVSYKLHWIELRSKLQCSVVGWMMTKFLENVAILHKWCPPHLARLHPSHHLLLLIYMNLLHLPLHLFLLVAPFPPSVCQV